jgi:hypothetical protein
VRDSSELVESLAEPHAQRYRERFASEVDPELVRLEAIRLAVEELAVALIEHGLFKRSPKGETFGAVTLLMKTQSAFENLHLKLLLEAERQAATPDPHPSAATALGEPGRRRRGVVTSCRWSRTNRVRTSAS